MAWANIMDHRARFGSLAVTMLKLNLRFSGYLQLHSVSFIFNYFYQWNVIVAFRGTFRNRYANWFSTIMKPLPPKYSFQTLTWPNHSTNMPLACSKVAFCLLRCLTFVFNHFSTPFYEQTFIHSSSIRNRSACKLVVSALQSFCASRLSPSQTWSLSNSLVKPEAAQSSPNVIFKSIAPQHQWLGVSFWFGRLSACFPPEIAVTTQRPDIVIFSGSKKAVLLRVIELTVPLEDRVTASHPQRK